MITEINNFRGELCDTSAENYLLDIRYSILLVNTHEKLLGLNIWWSYGFHSRTSVFVTARTSVRSPQKNIYFDYELYYLPDQSILKIFNLILKTNSLAVSPRKLQSYGNCDDIFIACTLYSCVKVAQSMLTQSICTATAHGGPECSESICWSFGRAVFLFQPKHGLGHPDKYLLQSSIILLVSIYF